MSAAPQAPSAGPRDWRRTEPSARPSRTPEPYAPGADVSRKQDGPSSPGERDARPSKAAARPNSTWLSMSGKMQTTRSPQRRGRAYQNTASGFRFLTGPGVSAELQLCKTRKSPFGNSPSIAPSQRPGPRPIVARKCRPKYAVGNSGSKRWTGWSRHHPARVRSDQPGDETSLFFKDLSESPSGHCAAYLFGRVVKDDATFSSVSNRPPQSHQRGRHWYNPSGVSITSQNNRANPVRSRSKLVGVIYGSKSPSRPPPAGTVTQKTLFSAAVRQ